MANTQSAADAQRQICIVGVGGGIGAALVDEYLQRAATQRVYALSRKPIGSTDPRLVPLALDVTDEATIEKAAGDITTPLDLIIVATGILHSEEGIQPEKTYRTLDADSLREVLNVNTVGPALVAKHFLGLLRPKSRSVFAAISARVGSITDNRLGGWYSYRASKAALNMLLKTASIEVARRHRQAIVIGLHPGTVDTPLSEPFQGNVPAGQLFTAQDSASRLARVIDELTSANTGQVLDWNNVRVPE